MRRDNPLKKPVPYLPDPATVRDAVLVRALYARIRHLPAFPSGVLNCPAGSGVSYDLNFRAGASTLLTAVAHPAGCGEINVGSEHLLGDTAFWLVLGAALRPAPGELDGFAEINGPAPPAPPSTGAPPRNAVADRVVLTLTTGSARAEEDGLPVTLSAAPGPHGMVPLRFVAEAFGASLVWHPKSRTVAVSLGASTLTLRVGSGTATVGSGALTLTEAPLLSHGVMLAPAAALARAFGGRVAPGPVPGSLVPSGPPDAALYRAESVLPSLPAIPDSTPASAPPSQPLYPCPPQSPYWRWAVGPAYRAGMRLSDVWAWSGQTFGALGDTLLCNGNESGTGPYNWADTQIFGPLHGPGTRIALQVEPRHGYVVWRYAVARLEEPARPPDETAPADATRVEVEVDQGDQVLARLVSSDAALAGRLAGELNALRVQPLTAEPLQGNYPCSTHFRFRVTFEGAPQAARFTQTVGCRELITFDRPGGDAQYPPLESPAGLATLAYDLLRPGGH